MPIVGSQNLPNIGCEIVTACQDILVGNITAAMTLMLVSCSPSQWTHPHPSLCFLHRPIVLPFHMRVLDAEAPYVQIITNGGDDVVNKASVDAHRQGHASELGSKTVNHRPGQRDQEDVLIGKPGLDQVCHNHLADGISIDEADEEHKWDDVVPKDDRLQRQICRDQSPGDKCGHQSK